MKTDLMSDFQSVIFQQTWRDRIVSAVPSFVLILVLVAAILPIATLIWISTSSTSDVWSHLLLHVLPRSIKDTLLLLILVALGTTLVGTGTAWLTSVCQFPGRRLFTWALVLPLAVPSYLAAYTHVEFFDYSGPVQTALRSIFGFENPRQYWFPDIRSIWGAGLIFTIVLYPYVFLTTRLVFAMQGASVLDASRSLGAKSPKTFWRIALPMARPAVAAGVALALMETLNDIGAVEILGVKTLSYAVFETWLNRDSLAGAVQLALLTLALVAGLIFLERRARRNRSYSTSPQEKLPALIQPSIPKQGLCVLACFTPLTLGLGVPLWVLGTYSMRRLDQFLDPSLITASANSILVSTLSATVATLVAYGLLQHARISKSRLTGFIGKISSLGYAIPGIVLAIGLLVLLAGLDNMLDALMRDYFGFSTGLLFSGSLFIVVYACSLRFLAIAHGTIESGFSKLSPHVDMAARALGNTPAQMAWKVHRPILARAMAISFLLVFVDTMKELSATLLLRPFDFETLATFVIRSSITISAGRRVSSVSVHSRNRHRPGCFTNSLLRKKVISIARKKNADITARVKELVNFAVRM